MTNETAGTGTAILVSEERSPHWWGRVIPIGEDLGITLALAAIVLLPLSEAVLRKTLDASISGVTSFVQHLTLIVGMLGGAIAARERRLLSLSTLETLLPGPWKTAARVFSGGVAGAITAFLCVAACQYFAIEREVGKIIAYGIPTWTVQAALPLGFGVIGLRVVWHVSGRWRDRLLAAAIAAALAAVVIWPPLPVSQMLLPALVVLLAAAVLGAPIYAVLGGAALLLFWSRAEPIASISIDHYRLVTNPTLPTVPLFTLAGLILAEGGTSKRLIRLFQALVGQVRGGPAILTAVVCAFFTSFTGASGVTILALGGLLLPVLLAAGYSERNAIGLLTGTGSLGLLLPPCLPLIFYAIIAQVEIERMFLGGLLPGILLIIMVAAWGVRQAPRDASARGRFDAREAWSAIWDAKWELLLPVVAFVGLFGGFATAVEAAALTALYAFVAEAFIYRDVTTRRQLIRIGTSTGLLIGGVLLILGVAMGFTNYLVAAEVPVHAADWVAANIHSRWMFLALLNLFLIVVGALMDIYSAIVIVVPLMVPIALRFGVDPIHLGIIFLANLELGFLTPPVGVNLFLSSYRFNKPVTEIFRAAIPMLIVYLVGVVLITYFPLMTTLLPQWLRP